MSNFHTDRTDYTSKIMEEDFFKFLDQAFTMLFFEEALDTPGLFKSILFCVYNIDEVAINLLARKMLLISNFASNFVDIVCSRPYNIKEI